MWYNNKLFKYLTAILLILLIIFLYGKISFFIYPLKKLFSSIFTPILIAGVLYYIFRPLVQFFQRVRIPKVLSIIVTLLIIVILISVFSAYTGSIIVSQFSQFLNDLNIDFNSAKNITSSIFNNKWFSFLSNSDITNKVTAYLESATKNFSNFVGIIISTITNIGTNLVLVPFILFFFLKDDQFFVSNGIGLIPKKYKENSEKILYDIDNALSSYILGQMLVALGIGIMMFIGFIIIGLKYALILALFAMITCIIPFFGPILGIIPAIFIGLSNGPFMIIKILIVMIVVQQIDGNFISPQIMGKTMHVHPLTVILLLIIGASLFGFVGLIFAIPFYAAAKVTIKNIYKMYVKV